MSNEYLNATQIWQLASRRSTTLRGEIRVINRFFMAQDDSRLWPIRGKFHVTRRAIRCLQRLQRAGLVIDDGYSYAMTLEAEIGRVVNDERNW